jgi:nitroreductase
MQIMHRRNILAAAGGVALAGVGFGSLAMRDAGAMQAYNGAAAATRAALKQTPEMADFIRYATLAPSGHNTQPWKFRAADGRVQIVPDFSRRTPVVDPDDHHLFVALGCSAETLAIAAGARGRPGEVAFDPADGGAVSVTFGRGASRRAELCDAIAKRQSTRSVYDDSTVGANSF